MASYHLSAKVGKVGSGANHSDYICREEKYKDKGDDDLVFSESGNLPKWANSAHDYWKTADENERANGSVYREFEIALPRELTPEQRIELVQEFIKQEIGDNKTYTVAIHNPLAAIEGGEQPHAHIMFSERILDGIDRDREQHFKRYNAKFPERGGCKKDNTGLKPSELKEQLLGVRERFAELQNRHLEKHGHTSRVDHRTLEKQGIDRTPEPHLGAKVAKVLAEDVRQLRAQNREQEKPKVDVQKYLEEHKQSVMEKLQARQALREQEKQQKLDAEKKRQELEKSKEDKGFSR